MRTNIIGIVADDHQLFADSFSNLLEHTGFFTEVQSFADTRSLFQYLLKNTKKEGYLFLDYYLNDQVGIGIINEIRRLNKNIKIIILSSVTNPVAIQTMMSFQPEGFISKSAGFGVVLDCLQNVKRGTTYCCSFIENKIEESLHHDSVDFSPREMEILQYFAKGFSVIETADKLFLSKHTVVTHRRSMMAKTQSKTITELLAFARKYGILLD